MAQSAKQSSARKSAPAATASLDQNGRGDSGNAVAQNMTDLDFLRGLIEAVDQSGIDSLEINRAGTRIRIAKTPAAPNVAFPAYAPPVPSAAPQLPAPMGAATGAPAVPAAAEEAPPAPAKSNLVDVTSPMVGTFYRAPAPDAPPYVEPGTSVSRGQTLCILEAMKLMNELQNEVDGVVREILVEDADPVEFGQVLFRIEPTGTK
jgi:acetyl-CoA carboxylase biotin carboxyl carrier protein